MDFHGKTGEPHFHFLLPLGGFLRNPRMGDMQPHAALRQEFRKTALQIVGDGIEDGFLGVFPASNFRKCVPVCPVQFS